MGFFFIFIIVFVIIFFIIKYIKSRKYLPKTYCLPTIPTSIKILKINLENNLDYENPIKRLLPFIIDEDIENSKLISSDEITFKYKNICGKPDLVFKLNNIIHIVEYKIRELPKRQEDASIYLHLMQVSICAYLIRQKYHLDNLITYLRYKNYVIKFNPEPMFEYIEFSLNIIPQKCYSNALCKSSILSKIICLSCEDIPYLPRDNAESSLKGEIMHHLMLYKGKIPKFNTNKYIF